MTRARALPLAALFLILLAPAARADGHATIFVGSNFFGDAGRSLDDALNDGSRLTWGAAVGGMTGGIFGAEVDVAHAPDFFGDVPGATTNYVLTVMPSLILGVPLGGQEGPGLRPYGTAGFGLIRRDLEANGVELFKDNGFGYSLGVGVNGYISTHFGIRADYRYMRKVEADEARTVLGIALDEGSFHFSRATVGALFRF